MSFEPRIVGCHPGDCHYQNGNMKAMRRFVLLRRLLAQLGVEPERVRMEWVSASEGDRFAGIVNDMTDRVRALGPFERLTFVGPETEPGEERVQPCLS